MKEPTPTRDEIRAVLANPASTERQIIEAKLVLGRRIANGADKVRQICEQYHLTPEQTAETLSSHQRIMSRVEDKAAEEVQRLEHALKEMQD